MAKERSAGAVVYRMTADGHILYLLMQASPGKPFGFPKGKIDHGENDEQAARREIEEEAGLRNIALEPGFRQVVYYTFRRGRGVINKEVVYFLAHVDTAEITLSWEHVAYRWAPLKDALEQVFYDNARELLELANDYLVRKLGIPRDT